MEEHSVNCYKGSMRATLQLDRHEALRVFDVGATGNDVRRGVQPRLSAAVTPYHAVQSIDRDTFLAPPVHLFGGRNLLGRIG